jgi:SOS-response transcriptional repressor LexA
VTESAQSGKAVLSRVGVDMTERKRQILEFIRAYIKVHGMSPSYEAIALGVGMKAKSNIHRIVRRLQEDGILEVKPKKFYGIRLFDRTVKEISSL